MATAIRYNRSGGEIRYQGMRSADEIILRFANTGPGIPDVDRERS